MSELNLSTEETQNNNTESNNIGNTDNVEAFQPRNERRANNGNGLPNLAVFTSASMLTDPDKMANVDWSPSRVAFIVNLHDRGLSTKEIAVAFFTSVMRYEAAVVSENINSYHSRIAHRITRYKQEIQEFKLGARIFKTKRWTNEENTLVLTTVLSTPNKLDAFKTLAERFAHEGINVTNLKSRFTMLKRKYEQGKFVLEELPTNIE